MKINYTHILFILGSFVFLTVSAQQQSYRLALLAQYDHCQGNFEKAFYTYKQLVQTTDSVHAYRGFIEHLFATNQFVTLAAVMSHVGEIFSDDRTIQLMYAQTLEQIGNIKGAHGLFVHLYKRYPHNFEIAYHTAASYATNNKRTEALSIIDTFLKESSDQPRHCLFYFLKAQLLLAMGDKVKALKSVKKSIELHPRFDRGWLMLGMLYELEGRVNKAIQGYTTFIELTGPDQAIEQQIAQLLLNKEAKPPSEKAVLLKVNALSAANKIDDALTLLAQWMNKEPENGIWFKAAHFLYRASTKQQTFASQLISMLKEVEKEHPTALNPLLYLADLYSRIGNINKALAYHHKVLKQSNDPSLKTKVTYQMGVLHYTSGNMHLMKSILEPLLSQKPGHAPTLNLMAYYYATDGNNGKQAETLIKQALAIDAYNPHFLDTKAVVLIKKKEYKKAHSLLEELIERAPDDFFINSHLALTHRKQGNKKESRNYAQHARKLARNEREGNICKKLRHCQ